MTNAALSQGSGVKMTTPFIRAELLQDNKEPGPLLWASAEAMVRWGRCGQIWGEGTVRRPVGFSLLMPPSRMQTRGKATLTRCAANCEKGKGEKKVTHRHWFYPVFPASAFSSSPLKPASRHAAIAATTQRNFQNPANRLLLSTKHKTLQLPVSSHSQRTNWKKRLLAIGICSDANSRVMTKYFHLTTKPEAVQL